jgi:hypothetical protein
MTGNMANAAEFLRARGSLAVATALAGLALVGCATVRSESRQQRVFADPASFVGQEVNICGHLVHGNIFDREAAPHRGLATAAEEEAIEQALVSRWGSRACVRGTVFFAGCETQNACLEWAFDYGIIVRSVSEGDIAG